MMQFQGHSPCHVQLCQLPLCDQQAPQSWLVPVAPCGSSPALGQLPWMACSWMLPGWDLSTGSNHLLSGNGFFCLLVVPVQHSHDALLPVCAWVHWDISTSLGWAGVGVCPRLEFVTARAGRKASSPSKSCYLGVFSLRMQGLLPHAACPCWEKGGHHQEKVQEQRCGD